MSSAALDSSAPPPLLDGVRPPALAIRAPLQLLIGGAWCDADGGATLETVDPGSGALLARVACAGEANVLAAVAAAGAAFAPGGAWRQAGARGRAAALERLAALLERDAEYVAQLEALDAGRPIAVARAVDAATAPQVLRYYAGWADKLAGQALPVAAAACGGLAYTQLEPLGVVAAICPFNFPLLAACAKIAPALSAGCTVVLKPAEQTPLAALHLGALACEADLPPGVINVLPGGRAAGAALARAAGVAKVSFTGSVAAGRAIAHGAVESGQRLTLELGGKNALIVLPDADVLEAAKLACGGNFFNAGQICVGISRVLVPDSLAEAFLAAARARARARTVGHQWSGADQGPLASAAQLERVEGYVAAGLREGARLVCGGRRLGAGGFYFEPTIFADVRDEMSIAREEIFGPVMCVQTYPAGDVAAAVRRANATPYGLAAAVAGRNLGAAVAVANALQAGTVWVNTHGLFDASAPYGGIKASGSGKEYGEAGLRAYCEEKTVMLALPPAGAAVE